MQISPIDLGSSDYTDVRDKMRNLGVHLDLLVINKAGQPFSDAKVWRAAQRWQRELMEHHKYTRHSHAS